MRCRFDEESVCRQPKQRGYKAGPPELSRLSMTPSASIVPCHFGGGQALGQDAAAAAASAPPPATVGYEQGC